MCLIRNKSKSSKFCWAQPQMSRPWYKEIIECDKENKRECVEGYFMGKFEVDKENWWEKKSVKEVDRSQSIHSIIRITEILWLRLSVKRSGMWWEKNIVRENKEIRKIDAKHVLVLFRFLKCFQFLYTYIIFTQRAVQTYIHWYM